MMQSIFITHANKISPRWQQAFPQSQRVDFTAPLSADMRDTILWVMLDTDSPLHKFSGWLAAGARIIVLTANEDPREAKQMLELGASGYLHYLAAAPVLEQVAQVVEVGGLWLGVDLMRQLVFATANVLQVNQMPSSSSLANLTQREKDVAEAVAAGKTNKEVARDLDITERTVKAHLSAVFEKLNVRDRLQLVLVMSNK